MCAHYTYVCRGQCPHSYQTIIRIANVSIVHHFQELPQIIRADYNRDDRNTVKDLSDSAFAFFRRDLSVTCGTLRK